MSTSATSRGKYAAFENDGRLVVRTNDLKAAKAIARVAEGVVKQKKWGKEVEIYNGGPARRNPATKATVEKLLKAVDHAESRLDMARWADPAVIANRHAKLQKALANLEKATGFKSSKSSSGDTAYRNPGADSSVHSPTSTSSEVHSPTSTSTEVRSPTSTDTSTEAYTADNVTVTGGAGAGANTTVHIRGTKRGADIHRPGDSRATNERDLTSIPDSDLYMEVGRRKAGAQKESEKSQALIRQAANPYGQLWFDDQRKQTAAWKKLRSAGFTTQKWKDNKRIGTGKPQYFLSYSGNGDPSDLERVLMANPRAFRRNPESGAAQLYEEFHGTPSDRIIEVAERDHWHQNLTELGDLVMLKVRTVTDLDATISFDAEGGEFPVKLASSEDGKQLFLVGGSQELDLDALEMDTDELTRDSMLIGELYMIHYVTKKAFDRMEEVEYFHELSEEGGPLPVLIYDSVNQKLSIAGGAYEVRPEGIVN